MPVLEVTAAIASILGGFASCTRYAKALHDKHKEKRTLAAEASRLHDSLLGSGLEFNNEWCKIERHFQGQTHQYSQLPAAQKSLDELKRSLRSSLSPLALLAPSLDFGPFHNLAGQSRDLTADVFRFLHGQVQAVMPASASTSQLTLSNVLNTRQQSMRIGRTEINMQDVCRNAVQYRKNYKRLDQLATPIPGTNSAEWTCTLCQINVGKVSCYLPGTASDMLWIGPEGMFKAHCTDGWSCIWHIVDLSCYERFGSERALLQHLKDHHATVRADADSFRLHWPADLRNWSAEGVGFGAIVRGREMRRHNFH